MLKPKKKILRKEIKKDPVLEKISQAEHYVREKGKTLSYILIAVVAVVVLAVLMIQSKQKANREAAGDLGMAEMALAVGDVDNAIVQFEALINTYPGTKNAGMATLLLASAYISKDDYENAEIYYRNYIEDYAHEELLVAAAYNGLGVCYEKKDDFRQAAEYFEKGGETSPFHFLQIQCYLNAARAYIKAGDYQQAESALAQIPADKLEYDEKTEYEILNAKIEVLKG